VTAHAKLTAETDVVSGATNLVFSYHIPIEEAPACGGSDEALIHWLIESHPMLLGLLVTARSPALTIARIRQAISLATHAADQTGHPSLIRKQRLQADQILWSTIAATTRDLLNRSIDADIHP
jgi:hypothetical protein